MPELPEVEHAARSLGAQVAGRTIVAVGKLDWPRMVETPLPDLFCALLAGRSVQAVGRRAKWIIATLDAGWWLALHLRMSGSLTVEAADGTPDRHTHLVLLLDDGRQVFFHDPRKFGRARLLDAAGLAGLNAAHGIEPLTDGFTAERLGALLVGRRTHLKPLLLDQRLIAGIGNIYADEALWQARLHPLRPAGSLSAEEVARLHTAIRSALELGLAHGGSTLRNYRNGYGEAGSHQEHFRVYDRAGRPCPHCGAPIEKMVVAQRGTHLCPACQLLVPST